VKFITENDVFNSNNCDIIFSNSLCYSNSSNCTRVLSVWESQLL